MLQKFIFIAALALPPAGKPLLPAVKGQTLGSSNISGTGRVAAPG